ERFIPMQPQPLEASKKVAVGLSKPPSRTAIPYPAGLALISAGGQDRLLIANNLSDNAVLLDPVSGKALQSFDLSTGDLVPSSFPYTCLTTRDGRRAWCSLANASQVAELALTSGKTVRWIRLLEQMDPILPGSHPTALALSVDEAILYVALSNVDSVVAVSTADFKVLRYFSTTAPGQKYAGSYPTALALTS